MPGVGGIERRTLLKGIGVGAGVAWVAPTVVSRVAAAAPTSGVSTCDTMTPSTVAITDTSDNTLVGYVSNVWNSFGEYVVTTTPSQYLTVTVAGTSEANVSAVNGPDPTYPLVGGIQGFSSSSPDLGSGSANYAYLGGVTATAAGATPQSDANSFSAATGIAEDDESAIWSVGPDGVLIPQWVNTDSSKPTTYLVLITGILVLTGDLTAFQATFGAATSVALNLTACLPTPHAVTPGVAKSLASVAPKGSLNP
jgi:hypothetical protein